MTTDPVQHIFARFEKNLQRTTGLVNSFYPVPGKTGRPATHHSDLLRAAEEDAEDAAEPPPLVASGS